MGEAVICPVPCLFPWKRGYPGMNRFVVMFVCTGNLCRSPIAEGILKDRILDEADSRHVMLPIDVFSAGIHAEEGQPAARYAVQAASMHGINLRFHRSHQLTGAAARSANLILVMEKRHVEYIRRNWADVDNVYELKLYGRSGEYLPEETEIMDPMGHGPDVYRRVFDELNEEVTRVSRILLPLVRESFNSI
jgi:protein-tyrosine-phosphatase